METATVERIAPSATHAPSLIAKFAARFSVEPAKLMTTLKATAFKQQPDRQSGEVVDATNEEMMALLVVADQYGLNPFTREIYAFRDRKRGGIVPIVGIDGWSRIVNEHPQFNGCEFGYGHDPQGKLEFIECAMFRKDREHPTKIREYLRECKRDTDAWSGMPSRMLRHRAFIQAARLAFGFVGIYDEDEGRAIIEGAATRLSESSAAIESINARVTGKPEAEFKQEGPAQAATAANANRQGTAGTPARDAAKTSHADEGFSLDGNAPPALTYAEVADAIAKAATGDALDAAQDLIRAVADERHRAELDTEARKRRKELAK